MAANAGQLRCAIAGLLAAATLFGGAGPAAAGEGLDVKELLGQPGVKLVVVEFYATWCKPCMEAVPKWEALRKKYEQAGLRFVVVSVKDEAAGCVSPGWTPDQMVCDDEGALMAQFGAKGLPAAYLWSWQGHLLAKAAHVQEVEAKIEAWMRKAPRVDVEVGSVVRGAGITKKNLLNSVRAELQANGKLVVVATSQERKSLRAIMRRSLVSSRDESFACEVGKEVSANSLVKVSISGKRGRKRLQLRLLSAERGCLVASGSSTWYAKNPRRSLSEASAKLLARLRLPVPQSPRSGALIATMSTRVAPAVPTAPTETSYEALLAEAAAATAKAEAAKKVRDEGNAAEAARVARVRAARRLRVEKAWASVSKIMGTTALNKGRRAGAVQQFLSDYPNDNPHLKAAQAGLAALKRGKEPNGGGAAPATAQNIFRVPVGHSFARGPKDALVTIVAFSDFQCPYCRRVARTLKLVEESYGKDVRIVFKHRPLPFHNDAPLASQYTLAAGQQGKFWAMHDKLFANNKALKVADLDKYARELGLDVDQVKAYVESGAGKKIIQADQALAEQVGARGTPTFFINGVKFTGAQPFPKFKAVIDQQLARALKLVSSGVARKNVYAALIKNGQTQVAPPKKKRSTAAPAAPERPVKIEFGRAPTFGPKNAPIKVVVYLDFECPYCRRLIPSIAQLKKEYKGKIQVAFKHFPLAFHKNATLAAVASLAAHRQGKFWQMHDKLFDNYKALRRPDLIRYAYSLGLDAGKFENDLDDPELIKWVKQDMAEGAKIGVRGTPNTFINGYRVRGSKPYAALKAIVDRELNKN